MLTSSEGQNWIHSNSKGVSAKHIPLEDFTPMSNLTPITPLKTCYPWGKMLRGVKGARYEKFKILNG